MKQEKLKILFVCTINRMRSATAHEIFKTDPRFEVKSAGTDPFAATVISRDLLAWADSVVVMEDHHRNFIQDHYPEISRSKKILCLDIPDIYYFMDNELISILKSKVNTLYDRGEI